MGSIDSKTVLVLASCSILGTVTAVFIAMNVSVFFIKSYIGVLVLSMGLLILLNLNHTFKFSWIKISSLGLLAAFNKGISGGGYGPLVTGGQILSGVKSKNAIGITSLSEGLTCLVGVIVYLIYTNHIIEWDLAPSLILGAVPSVPFAAYTVKKFKNVHLKLIVGLATLVLGMITLGKLFL